MSPKAAPLEDYISSWGHVTVTVPPGWRRYAVTLSLPVIIRAVRVEFGRRELGAEVLGATVTIEGREDGLLWVAEKAFKADAVEFPTPPHGACTHCGTFVEKVGENTWRHVLTAHHACDPPVFEADPVGYGSTFAEPR